MKTKNRTVDKTWLKQMDEKYYVCRCFSGYEISLRDEHFDATFYEPSGWTCSDLFITYKECKEVFGNDFLIFEDDRRKYLYEKAEKLFDEWHEDKRTKLFDAKISKLKLLLTTTKLKEMDFYELPVPLFSFDFGYDYDVIIIGKEDWKKILKNDAALRESFYRVRKAYRKHDILSEVVEVK